MEPVEEDSPSFLNLVLQTSVNEWLGVMSLLEGGLAQHQIRDSVYFIFNFILNLHNMEAPNVAPNGTQSRRNRYIDFYIWGSLVNWETVAMRMRQKRERSSILLWWHNALALALPGNPSP